MLIEPNVALRQRQPTLKPSPAPAGVATLEPVTVPLVIEDETRERYIEVLHRPERAIVAVLEPLPPTNKEEPGRSHYLAKRNALLRHPIHLVEVDLLIGGRRLPPEKAPPPGDYYALVSRGDRRPDCDVHAWPLKHALPAIPILLLASDLDVWFDLAGVLTTTYDRGRYGRSLNYSAPPPVSLDAETKRWIMERARGSNGQA